MIKHNSGLTLKIIILTAVSISALLLSSCKKEKKDNPHDFTDEIDRIDAYKKVHFPTAEVLDNGVFATTLKDNPAGERIQADQWLYFDFMAYDLNGKYYGGTFPYAAEDNGLPLGNSTVYQQFRQLNESAFPPKMLDFLTKAHIGDSLLFCLPSNLADRVKLWTESKFHPILLTIVPRRLVADPKADEATRLAAYIHSHPENHYELQNGVYIRTITDATSGSEINKSATVWITYEMYTLSGRMVSTNSPISALIHHFSLPPSYKLLQVKVDDAGKNFIRGFNNVAAGKHLGSTLELIVPSEFAYGSTGRFNIPPYEPLRVVVTLTQSF